jgi:hypothetical protein
VTHYKNFSNFLGKYEEANAALSSNSGSTIMCGEHGTELKESLANSIASMKNPFKHMRNWVKTELLDLQALMQAI